MAPRNEIAELLKRLRKESKISVSEAVRALETEHNFKISSKTLYGYESGLSMPNADVFVALCQIYGCENPISTPHTITETRLRPDESTLLGNYNLLNDTGKDKAQDYVEDLTDSPKYTAEPVFMPNAAHQRTDVTPSGTRHDEDVMDNPSEWD